MAQTNKRGLEGTAFYDSGAHDFTSGVAPVNFYEWLRRAKVEYKLANSPFAVFAAYQGTSLGFSDERVFDHRGIVVPAQRVFSSATARQEDTSP